MSGPRRKTRNFGDFELLQRVGRDGPFHLFRARQVSLDRLVTLKALPERTATLERAALLRRELDAGNRLDHPGILRIYEAGEAAGAPYLAMPPIDGTQLAERLKTSALPPRLAIDLARQLAEALSHAHERGVFHGSLRPEAVWVTRDGQARLTGFGCPIHFEELDTKAVTASAGYLAPEQAGGRGAVGRATDIYGLGALLYAMTTGVPPHQGATVAETCRMIRSQPPLKPTRLNPGLALALDDVCLRCLHLLPARRYGTWSRLLSDLRRVRSGRPDKPDSDFAGWLTRHARAVRVASLLFVFGVVPAFWDGYRESAAWDAVTLADSSPAQYMRSARFFDERVADRPYDREAETGLMLARFRTGELVGPHHVEPVSRDALRDELAAIHAMTQILQACREQRLDAARTAFRSLQEAGYVAQSKRERRLYQECQRLVAASGG